jgi:lipoprotein-releasing system permease protein
MKFLVFIAFRHLMARRRQSLVSIVGIILGVAFFLAISSLMRGSEADMIRRLVDNSPHITITDEYRNARIQPAEKAFPVGATQVIRVKPLTETRGIRGFEQKLRDIRAIPGLRASPVMTGQGLINYAGEEQSITLNGMIPQEIRTVTTIQNYMIEGRIDDLISNPDGMVIGATMAKDLSLRRGDVVTIASATGEIKAFKILGIFRTGRSSYDRNQVFVDIKRVQALLNRTNRINSILIKIDRPNEARMIATTIEQKIGYKATSWQEQSEDLMSTLAIRNAIMYTVVSAVLVVAAFGIYNVISTVVMEKQKDIAILKSMGFKARDIRIIFLVQGIVLGIGGCLVGIPLGCVLMAGLMQIRFMPPGASERVYMPLDWGWAQFAVAIAFAMFASILAAYLPARKGAGIEPIGILRGQM